MPLFDFFGGRSRYYIKDISKVGSQVNSKSGSASASDQVEYDVIVVGGGTSGCVLAARLTEDPSIRVLLLEAGGSGASLIYSRIPGAYSRLFRSKHVYQLYTEPQENLRDKKKFWPRGKLLGGCSSIHAEMAQYGAPSDFDEWAQITGDDSWSWKNFSSYFAKFEKYTPDSEHPHVDISAKGTSGPVTVGYYNVTAQSSSDFVKACLNLKMPFSADFNQASGTRGVNRIMTYVDENRQRVSSESAYLTPDVLSRPNLKVAIHAQVTRILFEEVDGNTRAVGVEFTSNKGATLYQARSRKEVIISAGAVHSPQILMLSGIGPAKHLIEHGIPVVHDLSSVGENLIDHPVIDFAFKDKTNTAPKFMLPRTLGDVFNYVRATVYYLFKRRGVLATNWGEAAAFCRSDDPVLFPPEEHAGTRTLKDSTSGSDNPDLEVFTIPLGYQEHGQTTWKVPTISIHVCLVRPLSTGNIKLKSSSPWDDPIINPNYLQNKDDLARLMRGTRLCLKIARTEPFSQRVDWDYDGPEAATLDMASDSKSDEEIEELVRSRLETLYHPTSTCRMVPQEAGGVVDSQCRVYGVVGLRVCDAAIFPSIVSGHTAGACYAVGEKLSAILKEQLGSSKV